MRENFTAEEWSMLIQAPMQAVMGICLADRVDPVSFLQEVRSGVALVSEETRRTDLVGDLAPALLSGIAELDAADPLGGEQLLLKKQFELLGLIQTFKTSKEGRDYAIAHLQKVAVILDTKVTGVQASELKQWLISLATKVAEAYREGGIMGIGSSRISDKENDMLNKMSAVLGL
ncbi:hypothetical protein ACQ4N7_29825 [Nodosilinea sp. AN01ver1]|uniref:hypothetical protein n=1 Tax=Nodosilinea sp. AN01ver1 TaxID=3423362 RepID=UPI003D31C228